MLNAEIGSPKNVTATATIKAGTVAAGGGQLLGFYVNSTSGGTLVLRDGGASGTAISGTITPVIGFHRFPAAFQTDLHVTIAVAAINVTFFVT